MTTTMESDVEKSKTINKETMKKYEKDNKNSQGAFPKP